MKNHSGWSWDDVKNCPVCDDDEWNEYIKAHKEAKVFRKRGEFTPFIWFNECEELFSKTILDAAGMYAPKMLMIKTSMMMLQPWKLVLMSR
eukprot:gene17037-22545_t